jgi:hypothetical protein
MSIWQRLEERHSGEALDVWEEVDNQQRRWHVPAEWKPALVPVPWYIISDRWSRVQYQNFEKSSLKINHGYWDEEDLDDCGDEEHYDTEAKTDVLPVNTARRIPSVGCWTGRGACI